METPSAGVADSIHYRDTREFSIEDVIELYRTNNWSSAEKPELLNLALRHCHSLITAWAEDRIVGLGNAISDGHLVVYYPHLLVHPDFRRRGIGSEIMRRLIARYRGFHQHMITADCRALEFYRKCGFERADATQSLWIYAGHDH